MSAGREFDEFMVVYEELAGSRPMYMSLKEHKEGIPRWRLQVFERGTAKIGGDMLILCIENQTKEGCLIEGENRLKKLIRKPEAENRNGGE